MLYNVLYTIINVKNCCFITACKAHCKVTHIKQQKYFNNLKRPGYNTVLIIFLLYPKLWVLTHRCPLGKAPVYLSNCCIPVNQILHGGIYVPLHVISWPYLDIVSALTVGGHLLSLVRRCLTLCQMIYVILQSAHRLSDSRRRHIFSLPISTFSALGVSHVMRSINVRYLLTYLLTLGDENIFAVLYVSLCYGPYTLL